MKRKPYVPQDKVYVQMRVYDSKKGKIVHVKGLTIIFERAKPAEVHALIVAAATEAQERARKAKAEANGKAKDSGSSDPATDRAGQSKPGGGA